MFQRLTLLFLIAFLFSSCAVSKLRHWKTAEFYRTGFLEEIPFRENQGHIYMDVEIQGKVYNFIFDTGAPNVLDERVAAELGLEQKVFGTVSDSYDRKSKLMIAQVDTIGLGELDFINTGAIIADFRGVPTFNCVELDGLIGANLMREAYWQINFQTQKFRVTDDLNRLGLKDTISVDFNPSAQGTPKIDMQVGDKKVKNVTIDYGSSNGLTVRRSMLEEKNEDAEVVVRSYGTAGVGLFGAQQDTVLYGFAGPVTFGESLELGNHLLRARPLTDRLIGTDILRHFIVTLDWKRNKLYLEPLGTLNYDWVSFGFGLKTENDLVYISTLHDPSPAYKAGLQVDDQVLKLDELDFSEPDPMHYCHSMEHVRGSDKQTIALTVLRDGKELQFTLQKEDLLTN